ncbi:MAG: peptidase S10 [Verrucomicrobiota bacterium]
MASPRLAALICFLFSLWSIPAIADHHEKKKNSPPPKEEKPEKNKNDDPPKEEISITQGSVRIDGTPIKYDATAGKLHLKTEKEDKTKAEVFYTLYQLKDATETATRPITFCFNGGPGSSSVWLHLGALGPRRVQLSKNGTSTPPPPYRLVDNEYSMLDISDLVLVDPVSTGYSRAEDSEPSDFHGFNEDISSMAEFIRLFITRHERWDSPKYLLGESYGAIRVSGLADTLQSKHGLYLNGVTLLSGVLDFRTLVSHPGSDLVHVLYMPAYAATAHYHGKLKGALAEDLQKAMRDAENFAFDEYMPALLRGDSLDITKKAEIAGKMSRFTGLSIDYLIKADLRPGPTRFRKELLRDEESTVGRFDARIKGTDRDTLRSSPDYDPSYTVIFGAFSSAQNAYLREELKFESDIPYEILSSKVHPWSYKPFTNRYVNVTDKITNAMRTNVDLEFLVLGGYHDLATPPAAIRYSLNHLPTLPESKDRIHYHDYDGGHMMYTNIPSLKAMKDDLKAFYERTKNVKSTQNQK